MPGANNPRASILLSLPARGPACWNPKEDLSCVPPADKYIEEQGREATKERCVRARDETHDSEKEGKAASGRLEIMWEAFQGIGQYSFSGVACLAQKDCGKAFMGTKYDTMYNSRPHRPCEVNADGSVNSAALQQQNRYDSLILDTAKTVFSLSPLSRLQLITEGNF